VEGRGTGGLVGRDMWRGGGRGPAPAVAREQGSGRGGVVGRGGVATGPA
jgi:hypothetical protein